MGILAFEFVWFLFNFNRMGLSKWLYSIYFGTIFMTTVMGTWVAGYLIEFYGHLAGFIAGFCITMVFYKEILKFGFMKFARFAFLVVIVVLFVIAFVAIFFRKTHLCYENVCRQRLDYF
jgi:hypothetical protein